MQCLFLLAVAFLCGLPSVAAAPVGREGNSVMTRQTGLSPPYWVVYSDKWVSGEKGPPDPSVIYGFNVFALSFLLANSAADQAQEWALLDAATRSSIKSAYASAGVKLIVAAFGSTEAPTSAGYDPVATANTMAAWVQQYDLDGIDVDYEDFNAMNAQDGSAETWLATFTTTLRQALPSPYIITHAPVAPWFSGGMYKSGAYVAVDKSVGSLIDWYNVQFYNQGTTEYTTCDGLLTESSATWPNSALFQIASVGGVPLNKLVIGKPANTADANNGYMDTGTLATCIAQAMASGWSGGVMTWQYPDAANAWIVAVRADSWPVSGSPPPPATTTLSSLPPPITTSPPPMTTSSGSSPTTTPSSPNPLPSSSPGGCSGAPAWDSQTAYVGGSQVLYNGHLWTANWWSEGDAPLATSGDWTDNGAC